MEAFYQSYVILQDVTPLIGSLRLHANFEGTPLIMDEAPSPSLPRW
jgi:hypothetical protein